MSVSDIRIEANRLYGGYIDQGNELESMLTVLHQYNQMVQQAGWDHVYQCDIY